VGYVYGGVCTCAHLFVYMSVVIMLCVGDMCMHMGVHVYGLSLPIHNLTHFLKYLLFYLVNNYFILL